MLPCGMSPLPACRDSWRVGGSKTATGETRAIGASRLELRYAVSDFAKAVGQRERVAT
jgi:hypothetical protein